MKNSLLKNKKTNTLLMVVNLFSREQMRDLNMPNYFVII